MKPGVPDNGVTRCAGKPAAAEGHSLTVAADVTVPRLAADTRPGLAQSLSLTLEPHARATKAPGRVQTAINSVGRRLRVLPARPHVGFEA